MEFPEDMGVPQWWQRTYLGFEGRFKDDCVVDLPGGRTLKLAQAPAQKGGSGGGLDPSVTGTTVWDAGVVLAVYLTHTGAVGAALGGRRCQTAVELGAGTGCVSLALAACGLAQEVVITDIPGVCDIIKRNVQKNRALIPLDAGRPLSRPVVLPLRWGEAADVVALPVRPPFDLVVGSDLIYYEDIDQAALLFEALHQLAGPGTVVFFAASLHHQPEKVAAFAERACDHFSAVAHVTGEVPEEFQGGSPPVVVLRLSGIKPAAGEAGGGAGAGAETGSR